MSDCSPGVNRHVRARMVSMTLMRTRSVVAAVLLLLAVMAGMMLRETASESGDVQAGERPKSTYSYAGNTNTKKFHKEGCRYFNCPNCTAKFRTRKDAIEAGYSPCGTCEP